MVWGHAKTVTYLGHSIHVVMVWGHAKTMTYYGAILST